IAYDRDEAGDRGAETVAEALNGAGIDAWRVRFPQGLDANAYALKSGNPESAFALALESASRMGCDAAPETVDNRPSLAAGQDVPMSRAQGCAGATAFPAETAPVACETTPCGELLLRSGPRVWRVRGRQKNILPEVMKVN
ncbi:toprim domain-containing protein, partial [Erwinia amylovora]|uniref:toprim domain-containing protein n=2 Tax=Erwinia amylovora TaxID=552 RepID=UPI001443E55C